MLTAAHLKLILTVIETGVFLLGEMSDFKMSLCWWWHWNVPQSWIILQNFLFNLICAWFTVCAEDIEGLKTENPKFLRFLYCTQQYYKYLLFPQSNTTGSSLVEQQKMAASVFWPFYLHIAHLSIVIFVYLIVCTIIPTSLNILHIFK